MAVPPDRMTSHPLTPTGIIPVQLVLKPGINLAAFFFFFKSPASSLFRTNETKGKDENQEAAVPPKTEKTSFWLTQE